MFVILCKGTVYGPFDTQDAAIRAQARYLKDVSSMVAPMFSRTDLKEAKHPKCECGNYLPCYDCRP
jgi:hypothetical protein